MRSPTATLWTRFALIVAVGAVVVLGCEDDKTTKPTEQPPEIPPLSTFQLDFDAFPTSSSTAVSPTGQAASPVLLSQDHWGWATLKVGVWQTFVTLGMIVPVAAFIESFNHEPEQQPDGTWVWSYDYSVLGGVQHTAALHADVSGSGVLWSMYISKQGEYDNFLWYSGWCDLLVTEGTWTLNLDPDDPTPWIGIEWHRDLQDSTADIKYTNIVPGADENGGYIFHGTTTDTTYDAFYNIYNKGRDNLAEIRWHRTTSAGKVKDQWHFGDSDWHCWDSSLQDIECP